jgi:hypothetical protein
VCLSGAVSLPAVQCMHMVRALEDFEFKSAP